MFSVPEGADSDSKSYVQAHIVDPKRIICCKTDRDGFDSFVNIDRFKKIRHDGKAFKALPNNFWSRDKQNVEDNLAFFSEEVEQYHVDNQHEEEALFVVNSDSS